MPVAVGVVAVAMVAAEAMEEATGWMVELRAQVLGAAVMGTHTLAQKGSRHTAGQQ